ncbi:hypothetical protein [Streptomyces regalis]|uniref:Uncharacterized protein n=1 Tax=Streptomyces regalis TaxID=68262 RepID=A0A117MLC3_9ACTN|nr:hypothetical protein ADL12_38790 [Streptomyces regalis]
MPSASTAGEVLRDILVAFAVRGFFGKLGRHVHTVVTGLLMLPPYIIASALGSFHVFAALAEFIRELIAQGTHEGLAEARARGCGSV